MLGIGNVRVPVCGGHGSTRRNFLQVGSAGLIGLSLPAMVGLQSAGAVDEKKAKIRNCITIFLVGSPGHIDTWDMKPDAPEDIRGKFKPISTSVPGVQICEHFPRMAKIMDRVALIRSLHYNTGTSTPHGQESAYLGSAHQPFVLGSDPARSDFKVADLESPAGQSELRVESRRNLLKEIDQLQRQV